MYSCPSRAVGLLRGIRRVAAALLVLAAPAFAQETAPDAQSAIEVSQAAIGTRVGEYEFRTHDGRTVQLSDYRGKPLALSFIYTSCADTCPTITETLASAAEDGWKALGRGTFKVVTVGFNAPADTPEAMRLFAGRKGLKFRDWDWLSGELPHIAGLARDTGFVFFDSPKGFDHIAQITLIDEDGVVRGQVYGDTFDIRNFVEPMKAMLVGAPVNTGLSLADRFRVFCTVYDPRSGKYVIDYSYYVEIAAGVIVLLPVAWFLLRNFQRRRRKDA